MAQPLGGGFDANQDQAKEIIPGPLISHAEYGSATFAAAANPTQYEVHVPTTGLLVRKLGRD